MCRKLIVFTIIIFLPFPALATANFGDLILGTKEAVNYDRQQRKKLAIDFESLFKSLDSTIPSLKPSEQEWINEEQNNIHAEVRKTAGLEKTLERQENLLRTVEYQQGNIKKHIKGILKAANCIIQAREIRQEIHCWAQLSYSLTDREMFDTAFSVLEKGKKIYISNEKKKKIFLLDDSLNGRIYDLFGRGINKSFVIPYLAGELKN